MSAVTAITAASDHCTLPEKHRKTAAQVFTTNETACFNALMRVKRSSMSTPSTASVMMPSPAPKYPP